MSDRNPDQPSDVTRELASIEQNLARAWVEGNREAISRILAPDWSVIDITGRVLTKTQVLQEMFASGDRPIKSMVIDDVTVRVLSHSAVVTGRTVAEGNSPDATHVILRFTDVFVRQAGQWQVVASQGTLVQP